ncbi:Protein of Unknown function [Modicisalibacter ilicicola DSM 19980]|uniref:DUF2784 domain-containing protein n=1 Tax=Modicisalibacter ilicicola DSM 19980 TaxID=1121942 RepID=A0A1M4TCD8_9GAMM|nr:DUF2784 domain-containing protein [Halomonas ilicicola]SHE42045.1 Protein of Unknown function [Halomonas ilicicola DSM 19980]
MGYRWAADAVLMLHLGFILFVVLGGLAALRWPRLAWLHLPAAIWAAALEFNGWICPLTPLENALLRAAGESGYAGGFIEHYLIALIYPSGLTPAIQRWLGLGVLAINLPVYVSLLRRWRRRVSAARRPG